MDFMKDKATCGCCSLPRALRGQTAPRHRSHRSALAGLCHRARGSASARAAKRNYALQEDTILDFVFFLRRNFKMQHKAEFIRNQKRKFVLVLIASDILQFLPLSKEENLHSDSVLPTLSLLQFAQLQKELQTAEENKPINAHSYHLSRSTGQSRSNGSVFL